jgi:hypothetical protein
MSNIKPKKKLLKIIDGIPAEVLQAVADLHSGKKEAIDYLKSQYGIEDVKAPKSDDVWGDEEEPPAVEQSVGYTPSVQADDPVVEFFNEYTAANPVEAAKVNEVYKGLDEGFKAELYDPKIFPTFIKSVESGEFDMVYPVAMKEKVLNPAISWIQAYGLAAQKLQSGKQNPTAVEPPVDVTPPKTADRQRNISADDAADRVWNDPEYYKELEAKLFGN